MEWSSSFENFEEEGNENDQGGKVTFATNCNKNSQKTETASMNPQLPPPMVQSNKESRPQIAGGNNMAAGNNQL